MKWLLPNDGVVICSLDVQVAAVWCRWHAFTFLTLLAEHPITDIICCVSCCMGSGVQSTHIILTCMDSVLSGWNGISQLADVPQVILCLQQFAESSLLPDATQCTCGVISCQYMQCLAYYWTYCWHASSDHLQVIVQSPDTDVAVICVHVYSAMTCHKLWYHTGVKNERRYIPIHDIVSATGPEVRQKCLVWTYVRPPVHDYLKPWWCVSSLVRCLELSWSRDNKIKTVRPRPRPRPRQWKCCLETLLSLQCCEVRNLLSLVA